MLIREARMNDLDDLFPIYVEGYRVCSNDRSDVFGEINELALRDILIDKLGNYEDNFIVIIDDNIIIGYLMYKTYLSFNYKVLLIEEIVITQEYQHKGYGKRLIEKIEDIAKKERIKRIELNCWAYNEDVINIYKKLGYLEQRITFEKNFDV